MGLFKEIATPLVSLGVPVIPLRPKTKIAFLTNWQDIASIDPTKIDEWDEEHRDANAACVAFAKPEGIWFLEIDKQGYAQVIEQQTGQKLPDTFAVRSSPGRGHYYFKQTPASIAMGNAQGKDSDGKETWSARVDNRYVVAPGSYHPTSGKRYELLRDVPIIAAPDWLVQWCAANHKSDTVKTGHGELDDETPIAEGSRNSTLASILGKARQVLGMDRDQLFEYGKSVNEKRCVPPLPESEVRTIAYSIGRYDVKPTGAATVLLGGVPVGSGSVGVSAQPPEFERPAIKRVAYPTFPRWVMKGTSLYDGFVKPFCDKNSRYPEFMFMPAMGLMLNYLALKVRIEYKNIVPSFYMVAIGRKGRVIKSSSVRDAVDYLHYAGVTEHASQGTRNAEGKSLVFTVGSPEGLGLEMSRTNCKNSVLFYDELSSLTNKASIEGSNLQSNLLTIYESDKFSNSIKSRKESYSFDPGTYCVSLIACTTDENFQEQWSRMAGGSSGLDERFFFLYQPEILDPLKPYIHVDTRVAAVETSKRINKAVKQGVYSITDHTPLEEKIEKLGNRTEIRVEKMALYFAVDLGRDEIDEECVERALAIGEYELAVKKYLAAFEATTREGALQSKIIQLLQRNAGQVTYRKLSQVMHPERHGTSLWKKVYNGLIENGWIAETGKGTKTEPVQIILLRVPEEDDDAQEQES